MVLVSLRFELHNVWLGCLLCALCGRRVGREYALEETVGGERIDEAESQPRPLLRLHEGVKKACETITGKCSSKDKQSKEKPSQAKPSQAEPAQTKPSQAKVS